MKEKLGRLHLSVVFAASWAGVAIFSWLFLSWTSSWFSDELGQSIDLLAEFLVRRNLWKKVVVSVSAFSSHFCIIVFCHLAFCY